MDCPSRESSEHSRAVWPTWLHTGQRRPGAEEDGLSGQLGAKWSGLPQVKQSCLTLVASAESHVAISSGSVVDQRSDRFAASFSQNCESYCSQA